MGQKISCCLIFTDNKLKFCWQPLEAANIITPHNTKVFGRVIVIAPLGSNGGYL